MKFFNFVKEYSEHTSTTHWFFVLESPNKFQIQRKSACLFLMSETQLFIKNHSTVEGNKRSFPLSIFKN